MTTRAPKRPRKQAQPLPAAAEFPGGLAIEPESAAREDGGIGDTYERLRPAASLSARAQARQDAALNPRKRGRPRKIPSGANTEQGDQEQNGTTAHAAGNTTRTAARRFTATMATAQPSRFSTESERRRAGIRRPSRNRRNYDKGNVIDDSFLYEFASNNNSREQAKHDEENAADLYFKYNSTYEAEENDDDEEDGNGAGPSRPSTVRKLKAARVAAGVDQQRNIPRKGEPLSTYKTKLKKIGDEKSKRRVASLADQDLDPDNWTLKKIVSWAGSRERKLKAEERKAKIERQKEVAADIAAGGTGNLDGAVDGGEAGTSTVDAQQQHPNRRAGAGRRVHQATLAPPSPSGASLPAGTSPLRSSGGNGRLLASQHVSRTNANLAPQVHMVDGRIVVNRQSLTVQAQEREHYTRVITEDMHRVNSMTYTNRISNERWTTEDTELFYKALSQFGTDFTLISHLFPGRERRHLKNKFTRENKLHPQRIDEAMNQSSNVTINSYTDMIVMLKESGMAVGAGAAEAAEGVAAPSAPAAAAVLNGIPSSSSPGVANVRPRASRGGNNDAIAPLAITEAGEPASQDDKDDDDEAAAEARPRPPPGRERRGGRKPRVAIAN